jgi:hypothetical protein
MPGAGGILHPFVVGERMTTDADVHVGRLVGRR